jgi:X-X-X-Leu-X-X-Gly heptad repeat protein
VRGTSGVCEPPTVSPTGGRGATGVGRLMGGGALEVGGKVGTVGGTGTLTVGTGTLTAGTGTLTVGRLGSALAGAITCPEPYPAPNTHAPMSNVLPLAPAPLAMISH